MFPSFKRQDIHPAISWPFYDVFDFCIFPLHSEYFTDIKATCFVGQITILNWSSNTNEVPLTPSSQRLSLYSPSQVVHRQELSPFIMRARSQSGMHIAFQGCLPSVDLAQYCRPAVRPLFAARTSILIASTAFHRSERGFECPGSSNWVRFSTFLTFITNANGLFL